MWRVKLIAERFYLLLAFVVLHLRIGYLRFKLALANRRTRKLLLKVRKLRSEQCDPLLKELP